MLFHLCTSPSLSTTARQGEKLPRKTPNTIRSRKNETNCLVEIESTAPLRSHATNKRPSTLSVRDPVHTAPNLLGNHEVRMTPYSRYCTTQPSSRNQQRLCFMGVRQHSRKKQTSNHGGHIQTRGTLHCGDTEDKAVRRTAPQDKSPPHQARDFAWHRWPCLPKT